MSYNRLLYHIVFRPKGSLPAITEAHEKELYNYIWGFARNNGCVLHRIGGMPNHLHMLIQLPTTVALADFMRELKTSTNKWMRGHGDIFPLFGGWARAYCAVTCSYEAKDAVARYISEQKAHHAKVDFIAELRDIFNSNDIENTPDNFIAER